MVFDLDGTLTTVDSLWRYLHQALGTWDRGKIAAQKYWRREISYREWAETDARCWAGLSLSQIQRILDRIRYRKGAREVFRTLREEHVKTVILSAGLSLFADKAAKELGADLALSNEMETNDGRLTGSIVVKVAVEEKKQIIQQTASLFGVQLDEVALVGDRAYDLPELECLRIAFKPKDEVARQQADVVVEDDDLSRILQYLH